MTARTIHDTCDSKTIRTSEVQDIAVQVSGQDDRHFVRGRGHIPRDVVDYALRSAFPTRRREDLYMMDAQGYVLYPVNHAYTSKEFDEVMSRFRGAPRLFVYLRLQGVTP